jgi:hypothetical protein
VSSVDYAAAFWFPVPPGELWDTIEQFERFPSWWLWLQDFDADAPGLVPGNVLHGTVLPPVPYPLRLDVRLVECTRPQRLEAFVDGDLRGRAVFLLDPLHDGTQLATSWSLEFVSAPLRVAARIAYPVLRWGHDRVVEMAVAGFRRRALSDGT